MLRVASSRSHLTRLEVLRLLDRNVPDDWVFCCQVARGKSVLHCIPHLEGVMDTLFSQSSQNVHFSSKRGGRKCSLLTSTLRGCFLTPASRKDTEPSLFSKRLRGSCPPLYWTLRRVFTNPVFRNLHNFFEASDWKRKRSPLYWTLRGVFH